MKENLPILDTFLDIEIIKERKYEEFAVILGRRAQGEKRIYVTALCDRGHNKLYGENSFEEDFEWACLDFEKRTI